VDGFQLWIAPASLILFGIALLATAIKAAG
jgi:hypothetical protein